jgi:ADP-ribosylglycohydrolase
LASLLNASSYESALRSNMLAGGDCCSRAIFIGACLGAKFGIAGIPVDWLERVNNIEDIVKMAEQIMI